jgi:hypothetical protein
MTVVVLIAWATGAELFRAPSYFTRVEENPLESGSTLTLDLGPAVAKELIIAYGWGNGLESIQLVLESRAETPLRIVIPPGTVLEPLDAGVQSMVVRERSVVPLPQLGSKESVTLAAACLNMRKATPHAGSGFRLGSSQLAADLRRLLRTPEFLAQTFRVQQFAIWTVTDNPEARESVGIGNLELGSGPDKQEVSTIMAIFRGAGIPAGIGSLERRAEGMSAAGCLAARAA